MRFFKRLSRFFLPVSAIMFLFCIPFAFIFHSTFIFYLMFISVGTALTSAFINCVTDDLDYTPVPYNVYEDENEETYNYRKNYGSIYDNTKDKEVENNRKNEAKELDKKNKHYYRNNDDLINRLD